MAGQVRPSPPRGETEGQHRRRRVGVLRELAFAFVPVKERTLLLFLASLITLAGLVVVQRLALWSYHHMMDADV